MSAYPSLPLFTDAFIADTGHLSALETGAYLMLLMVAWRSPECRLADDDDRLARWGRVDKRTWLRIKPTVMEFWTLENGFWTQKRLSKERDVVSKRAEVARDNGQHGGRPKSLKTNNAANPDGSPRVTQEKAPNPNPSKEGSSLRSDPSTHTLREADFPVWWEAYPHKVGKDYAAKVFGKLVDAKTATLDELLSGTERYRKTKPASHEWCNPSTWLNQGRWKDQPASPVVVPHVNGARAGPRRPLGPTMEEIATMDLPLRQPDEPRTHPAPEPKSNTADPKACGFAGRLSVQDRENGNGQVLDLRGYSAVRG